MLHNVSIVYNLADLKSVSISSNHCRYCHGQTGEARGHFFLLPLVSGQTKYKHVSVDSFTAHCARAQQPFCISVVLEALRATLFMYRMLLAKSTMSRVPVLQVALR